MTKDFKKQAAELYPYPDKPESVERVVIEGLRMAFVSGMERREIEYSKLRLYIETAHKDDEYLQKLVKEV